MKREPLIITEEDIAELQKEEGIITSNVGLSVELKAVFDIVKQRKLTTLKIIQKKLGIGYSTASSRLNALVIGGYVGRQYKRIKGKDGSKHNTGIYFPINKNGRRKSK